MFLPLTPIVFLVPVWLYHALRKEYRNRWRSYEEILTSDDWQKCMAEAGKLALSLQPQTQAFSLKKEEKKLGFSDEECLKIIHYHLIPQKEKGLSLKRKTMPLSLISCAYVILAMFLRLNLLSALLFSAIAIMFEVEFLGCGKGSWCRPRGMTSKD